MSSLDLEQGPKDACIGDCEWKYTKTDDGCPMGVWGGPRTVILADCLTCGKLEEVSQDDPGYLKYLYNGGF
jgi:hypothetical protein